MLDTDIQGDNVAQLYCEHASSPSSNGSQETQGTKPQNTMTNKTNKANKMVSLKRTDSDKAGKGHAVPRTDTKRADPLKQTHQASQKPAEDSDGFVLHKGDEVKILTDGKWHVKGRIGKILNFRKGSGSTWWLTLSVKNLPPKLVRGRVWNLLDDLWMKLHKH